MLRDPGQAKSGSARLVICATAAFIAPLRLRFVPNFRQPDASIMWHFLIPFGNRVLAMADQVPLFRYP